MNETQKRTYTLPIAYDILLSSGFPLTIAYICFCGFVGYTGKFLSPQFLITGYVVCAVLWFFAVFVLGLLNIVQSFRKYAQGADIYCLNAMLTLKYGLVVYFILNFVAYALIALVLLAASRGTLLLAFPLYPMYGVIFLAIAGGTWLALLPGAFYGLQIVRFGCAQGKLSSTAAVLHGILQFVFLFDVLDALYLSVKLWGRGKKSAVAISIVYAVPACLLLYFYLRWFTL